jgi:hypothetical protein
MTVQSEPNSRNPPRTGTPTTSRPRKLRAQGLPQNCQRQSFADQQDSFRHVECVFRQAPLIRPAGLPAIIASACLDEPDPIAHLSTLTAGQIAGRVTRLPRDRGAKTKDDCEEQRTPIRDQDGPPCRRDTRGSPVATPGCCTCVRTSALASDVGRITKLVGVVRSIKCHGAGCVREEKAHGSRTRGPGERSG